MPKFQNIYRNFHKFSHAKECLGSGDTNGDTLSNYDGEFNVVCDTYSSDVNFQYRIPEKLDYINNKYIEGVSVDRTIVSDEDYDVVTEAILDVHSGQNYQLTLDEASGDTEALPNNYLEKLPVGTTFKITQSSTEWVGNLVSINHTGDTEAEIIIHFPTNQVSGTFVPDSTITIQIGVQAAAGTWKNVVYDGEAVVFDGEGETKIFNLSAQINYRFNTSSAGSIMYISPIWQNASSD